MLTNAAAAQHTQTLISSRMPPERPPPPPLPSSVPATSAVPAPATHTGLREQR